MSISIISAGTQVASSGTAVMSNASGITFGMTNSSIITATAGGSWSVSYAQFFGVGQQVVHNLTTAGGASNMWLFPMLGGRESLIQNMTVSTFMIELSGSNSGTTSGSANFSLGIYTLNASTLSLQNSVSTQLTWAAATNNSTAYSGLRWLTIHSSQWSSQPVFTQTNYWVALGYATSNASQGFGLAGFSAGDSNTRQGTVGVSSSASTFLMYPFWGVIASTGLPVTIGTAAVVGNLFQGFVPNVVLNNADPSF